MGDNCEWPGRWNHLRKILERTGPFAHPQFEASPEMLPFIQDSISVLVVGAGGLGCELLKDLALMGFRNLAVIDMDTIDLSNLNRQFLFRRSDIGKPKSDVAAAFINNRIPGCRVKSYYAKIQDFGEEFYKQFHIVVCGLDSIVARRWINGMLVSMVEYDEQGVVDQTTIIPLVDGGTEGFKGNARVILPGMSPCIECTLDLYPPQVNFPMCTIAHTPRLPEHCIEWVKVLLWPQEKPFAPVIGIDGDDPKHIKWIFDRATERADKFNITGVTYRLTQGVVKRIIPAVASTNALIAAVCASEVFKLACSCCQTVNNYMNFNDAQGIYTYTFEAEKREDCAVCSQKPQPLNFSQEDKLSDVIDFLKHSDLYQLKNPGVVTTVNGKNRTLYISTVKSIEEATKPNLKKTLHELNLVSGQELHVADSTSPSSLRFILHLATAMEK